jgi:5-methyltetrahydrofolate--homocysteine methyltransferase
MEFKPDFEAAVERVEAFWARDCIDRCALRVVARREDYTPLAEDVDVLRRKTDVDIVVKRAERTFANHHYLAEAVPVYTPGLVCSDTAAWLSEQIRITDDTVWYPRIIDDWSSFKLTFDQNNRWWQMTKSMAEEASERGADRYLVGVPDFQAGIDIVSLLRSPEKLCVDLLENPDAVKAATSFILNEVWGHCYGEIRAIVARRSDFIGDWMGLFSQGEHDIVQCDFCALVSPRHFEEFCLPDIEAQCRRLETAVFHLDGPGSVRHVDALLEIDELDAIQWVPGAGNPTAIAWLPMLRRIQAAGKSLYLSAAPADVEAILDALSPKGLMISVAGAFESLSDGQRFVAGVERMCASRA